MNATLTYFTTEKKVGETPLQALERGREEYGIPKEVPLAYAGRLDPMASGKLLILVGDECKRQTAYHTLDKEYRVEILLGASSDTGDVLGLITGDTPKEFAKSEILNIISRNVGTLEVPYPHFSSKTVHGKPLHVWTLENKLHEITIPTKKSRIYRLTLQGIRKVESKKIISDIKNKIETIPPVTDPRKALGADFRREAVHASWDTYAQNAPETLTVLSLTCIASSGSYMRSLAEKIGTELGTKALALSIHRTQMGTYVPFTRWCGFWRKKF